MTRIELNSSIWCCFLVESFPLSLFSHAWICLCTFIMHVCALYISVGDQRTTLSVIPQIPSTFFSLSSFLSSYFIFYLFILDGRGGEHASLSLKPTVWPAGLRDQPVSASRKLKSQVCVTVPGFCSFPSLFGLFGLLCCKYWFWRSNSGHSCKVSSQPRRPFLMFLYPVRKDMELDCAWIFLWVQYQS